MPEPWETGWQPVDGPPPGSTPVDTKVVNQHTYHLWKSPDGTHTIEDRGQYYRVSPGAFNTIPPEHHFHHVERTPIRKDQT